MQDSDADAVTYECAVHDRRIVRSSTGHTQERIVVLTPITLAGGTVDAEVTLSNRDKMGFRMLVGGRRSGRRSSSTPRVVHRRRAPKEIRRRNRGRA